MINRDRQEVVDTLVTSFRRNKSPDDGDYAQENFRQDVTKAMDTDGTCPERPGRN